MRLLLVEDDPQLGEAVQTALQQEGYSVDWMQQGQHALSALQSEPYELVVLDLGLPDTSGLDVLKALRGRGQQLPVLVLTARDTIADRVSGLDVGADDYLTKPFDLDELFARLRAISRRQYGRASNVIECGPISLDPAAHTVHKDGRPVEIAPKEFAVLQTLLENRGRVMSRQRLEQSLYDWGQDIESNAVEVYIHHLRKKLGSELIRTIRGVGYIIDKRS